MWKYLTLQIQHLSIRNKLLLIIMSICTLTIATISSAWLYHQITEFRADLLAEGKVISQIIGQRSILSLQFSDKYTAQENLKAANIEKSVLIACIYDDKKKLFSAREGDNCPNEIVEGHLFSDGTLQLSVPIIFDDKELGHTFLTLTLDQLYERIANLLVITLVIVIVSLITAWIFANIFQRIISRPIGELAKTVFKISRDKDFSQRAIKSSDDDLGLLVDGFNNMIAEIEASDLRTRLAKDVAENAQRQLVNAVKQAEEARIEAEEANRLKSDFLANMSHEIRTPMNGIFGMAELVLEGELTHKQRKHLETLMSSAEVLLTLIDDILDFSKIEAGKLELEPVPVNLRTLVESIAELLTIKVQDKNVEIIAHYVPGVPEMVIGDPVRIRQIITNLVGNAIKFTENGHILITIEAASSQEGHIKISVTDTGIGIPLNARKKIFEKFSQADNSTTRKYGGTGLGLAICQQLTAAMGGEIGLTSEENVGSTFWFTVKLSLPDQEAKDITPNTTTKAVFDNTRILIIDDIEMNNLIIEEWLIQLGAKCTSTTSAMGALLHIGQAQRENTPYDIVLIDFMMPEINGLTLGNILKHDIAFDDSMLVMMSAWRSALHEHELQESGFSAFITKPLRKDDLEKTLPYCWKHFQKGEGFFFSEDDIYNDKAQLSDKSDTTFNNIRILVAEDNRINQEFIKESLTSLGCDVVLAVNGKEAIDILHHDNNFHLIFMDCQMPVMDGFKASHIINQEKLQEKLPQIPVIALTANAMKDDRKKCLEAGMQDYAAKPIRRKNLIEILRRWLPVYKLDTSHISSPALEEKPSSDSAGINKEIVTHSPYRNIRILIVEDNHVNCEFLMGILSCLECVTDTAKNGEEAISQIKDNTYDIIMMDCQMPVLDGYSTTRIIRQMITKGQVAYVPIIAITANALRGDREKCLAAGMDDYCTKPIRKKTLIGILDRWVLDTNSETQEPVVIDEDHPLSELQDSQVIVDSKIFDDAKNLLQERFPLMVRYFIQDTARYIETIEQALNDNDNEAIATQAHTIKSSSKQIGALALAHYAKELEDLCHSTTPDSSIINETAQQLQDTFALTCAHPLYSEINQTEEEK